MDTDIDCIDGIWLGDPILCCPDIRRPYLSMDASGIAMAAAQQQPQHHAASSG